MLSPGSEAEGIRAGAICASTHSDAFVSALSHDRHVLTALTHPQSSGSSDIPLQWGVQDSRWLCIDTHTDIMAKTCRCVGKRGVSEGLEGYTCKKVEENSLVYIEWGNRNVDEGIVLYMGMYDGCLR